MTTDTAIIGIGCRLPGATGPSEFWDLIRSGSTTFDTVDEAEARRFGYTDRHFADNAFVPVRSALKDFDSFDADFFGISNRDAALMDPQQRVFLETVWAALADAGHTDDHSTRRIGVFGSSTSSTYLTGPVTDAGLWNSTDINFSAMLANDKDFLCTRTSYTLGLTGPSVVVQSACSSSLLAVHMAKAALARNECDLAIVGGVSISLPHLGGYLQRAGSIFSPSGACRPFDAAADGTVKAHGAAAVVLRRIGDLDPARDRVYAVIAGSAANNDGSDKAGYPAPGVAGQAAVISAALEDSGLPPSQIRYIETHGTGTTLGDPIEIRALAKGRGNTAQPCYLGSVKATLGHLDAAAGVTGLIKAALVLQQQLIPPLAGFRQANPLLALEDNGFVAPMNEFSLPGGIPAAGVSSFGMGGTNVHVVLRRAHAGEGCVETVARPVPTFARTRHWVEAPAPIDAGALQLSGATVVGSAAGYTTGASAGAGPSPVVDSVPRAVTDSVVLELVRDVLADASLELDSDLFDAGADSLDAIDLLAEFRAAWAVELAYSVMERARTPRALAAAVRSSLVESTTAPTTPEHARQDSERAPLAVLENPAIDNLVTISAGGPRTLFLVHPAGGTTSLYVDLARHTDGALTVMGLAFPESFVGRSHTMRQLAAHYLAAIRFHQPEGPYLIGGYSFGGNLAAEIVLQLQEQGIMVERLVMIDAHPPHAYTSGECTDANYLEAFPRLLQTLLPEVKFLSGEVDTSSAERVLEQVSKPKWAQSVRSELVHFFGMWCENHRALKRWTPDSLITCPVLIFEASEPEPQDILDCLGIAITSVHEWERYVSGRIEYVGVQGDHYSIFRDPSALQRMGEVLRNEFVQV